MATNSSDLLSLSSLNLLQFTHNITIKLLLSHNLITISQTKLSHMFCRKINCASSEKHAGPAVLFPTRVRRLSRSHGHNITTPGFGFIEALICDLETRAC